MKPTPMRTIRIPDADWALIALAANRKGTTASELIRRAAVDAARLIMSGRYRDELAAPRPHDETGKFLKISPVTTRKRRFKR